MNKTFLGAILVVLLTTGTLNTIFSKSQDHICVDQCDDKPQEICYVQPVWQAIVMFIGEILCLIVYRIIKQLHRPSAPLTTPPAPPTVLDTLLDSAPDPTRKTLTGATTLLMWIPALCDILGTSIMMLSLTLLSSSVFQMLRGAVVIFTALASVIFLRSKLPLHRWFALGIIACGLLLVGLFPGQKIPHGACGEQHPASASSSSIQGILLVLLSQVFTSFQFVAEEKIMSQYKLPPLKAVGLEGVFGFSTCVVTLLLLHVSGITESIKSPSVKRMFDINQGFYETFQYSTKLTLLSVGSIFAIAFFNFCGLSITRILSSTSRSTIDILRTLFVWFFTLFWGWETFSWPQLVGFGVMVYGTLLFNNVVGVPLCLAGSHLGHREEEEAADKEADLASEATNEERDIYDEEKKLDKLEGELVERKILA